jgi:hypothetical protein
MRPRLALGLSGGVSAFVALAALGGQGAGGTHVSPAASHVFDRTYLCTNAPDKWGMRVIGVYAAAGFHDAGSWKWLATAAITNTGTTPTKLGPNELGFRGTVYTHCSFAIPAGSGPAQRDPDSPREEPGVRIWSKWAKACDYRPKRRIPLTVRRLDGGGADYFGDRLECRRAPRKVFVRVRAVFGRVPTPLRLEHVSGYLQATGPLAEASLAVRTESGKPLAFAAVSASGKARLFTAPSCVVN